MKKQGLLVALLLALCLMVCAASAEGASPWYYDSGNYCLKLTEALHGDVVIPNQVDGYAVNALKDNLFYGQHDIVSLTMPDTLRALQDGTISGMDGLTSVTLNDGLEYIGSNFRYCGALTSLTIPSSVRMVRDMAASCGSLKEIRFEGVCPLFLEPEWSFIMMPEDYTIYVPDDQLEAYAAALSDANGAAAHLKPSGKQAIIPEKANAEDWFVFDAQTGTITGYKEFHAYVEIPASIHGTAVKAIGPYAFERDYSIYGVVLPEGLESVEEGAFRHASNLNYLELPTSVKTIGDDAFFNAQLRLIQWSEGLESIGARAFQYDCTATLTLPTTVRYVGESAFEDASFSELYLGGDMESIGSRAFADNNALGYMAFDFYTLIDIAPDAFVNTPYVTDLDLPWDSSLENRDAYAAALAEQCPNCTVWVNNPIIGSGALFPEDSLMTLENGVWLTYEGQLPDLTIWTDDFDDNVGVTALGEGIFKGSQTIRSFYPHHCGWFTTIGKEAFADSTVSYVELFGSITTIGEGAFRNCRNLTELILPASLTSIGEGALDGCTGLTRLVVLCDPAILPENLLASCTALTEIYAAPQATDEQVRTLTRVAGRPWYMPVARLGEAQSELCVMPYAPLPGDDFWYDEEYSRLDAYQGYEVNLVLPRSIDGTAITMIGTGMMGRASGEDAELPVRSVVIPETYTSIPYGAFEDCQTLETVICYAPLEALEYGTFRNCSSLREVVFVNGVSSLGMYVFEGCTSLETVYLGSQAVTRAETFLNQDGSLAFDADRCITDAAQMPDVDALLAAVQSDPITPPDDDPDMPLVAVPVGAEGAPYLGTWSTSTVEMGGDVYNAADLDMMMVWTLTEDGIATLFDGESTEQTVWGILDGTAYVDSMMLTLTEDGRLCASEDGIRLYFVPGEAPLIGPTEPEGPAAGAPTDMGDRLERKFVCTSADVSGFTMNKAMLGGEYSMIFHADGTAEFTVLGTSFPGLTWTATTVQTDSGEAEAFCIDYYGNMLKAVWTDTGFDMDYLGAMLMHFAPDTGSAEPEGPAAGSPIDAEDDRLEQKFVCNSADVSGFTMSKAMLGGEYSMTFHADGTAEFVVLGTGFPGLAWTSTTVQTDSGEAEAFCIDYYGNMLNAVWTDAGFDMDYLGAMLMHFVPAD